MQVRILGCSGGIGGALRTTSMLVDDDVLVDAGTGVADLSIEAMLAIDHIFLTHSHLDHTCCLPMLVDTVIGMRDKHLTLHATQDTWHILKQHLFNWKLWPDFSVLPNAQDPFLRFSEIRVGETVNLGGRLITPLPVKHVVPAVGFRLDSGRASLVFSGDTTSCPAFWEAVNTIDNLRYLIIEASFGNDEMQLAQISNHLCPALLVEELSQLRHPAQIYITHLKPGEEQEIMRQIAQQAAAFSPMRLQQGQVIAL